MTTTTEPGISSKTKLDEVLPTFSVFAPIYFRRTSELYSKALVDKTCYIEVFEMVLTEEGSRLWEDGDTQVDYYDVLVRSEQIDIDEDVYLELEYLNSEQVDISLKFLKSVYYTVARRVH